MKLSAPFFTLALLSPALLYCAPAISQAEDLKEILARVESHASKGQYSKALEELGWAKKELESKHSAKLVEVFPAEILGLKGAKADNSSALGMMRIERSYSGDSTVKVQLNTGAGGAANAGLGGLAALGQMAAMMGNQPGQETVRIKGRTALLQDKDNSEELTLFLDGGAVMMFSRESGNVSVKEFAEAFPLDNVEKYLKGQ